MVLYLFNIYRDTITSDGCLKLEAERSELAQLPADALRCEEFPVFFRFFWISEAWRAHAVSGSTAA